MRGFYMLLLTLGAAGSSKADLGEIDTFEIVAKTETSITLQWGLGPSDQAPIKYIVSEDDFNNTDVHCNSPCTHKFEFMEQCSFHEFSVTAWYMVNGAPQSTETASVNGTTVGAAPDAPTGLVAVPHNHNVDLSWTPPADVSCLEHWQVCYHLKGTIDETCETTNLNGITLHGLQKCAEMIAKIKGVTPEGVQGKPLSGHFEMGYGDPSPIRNLTVGEVTNSTCELMWTEPATNPLCIDKYSIDYGINPSADRTQSMVGYDNHAKIGDLDSCTSYLFEVSSVSSEGFESEAQSVTCKTLCNDFLK